MISFYPGPSRIHDMVPAWVQQAHEKGILSMSHRSSLFMNMTRKTISQLKKKLSIPDQYTVFFATSATECWEMIAHSLVLEKSIHLQNGAFGLKWYDYTRRLKPSAHVMPFGPETELHPKNLAFPDGDVICLTHNETSNGTCLSNKIIRGIQENNQGHLIAVDATSSMGGVYLNFESADCWFASVQKCFGLPAGLAVMVCSPRAMHRIEQVGNRDHFNSLVFVKEMMDRWQTVCTPNVLGIYLLQCAARSMDKIRSTDKKVVRRQKDWVKFFKKSTDLQLFVANPEVRSKTVITVKAHPDLVETVKKRAWKRGLLLGEGYGELKRDTFRIANFPALRKKEIQQLKEFLSEYR